MLAERQAVDEISPDVLLMLDAIAELSPSIPPAQASNESAADENGVEAPNGEPAELDENDG